MRTPGRGDASSTDGGIEINNYCSDQETVKKSNEDLLTALIEAIQATAKTDRLLRDMLKEDRMANDGLKGQLKSAQR